MTVTTIPSDLKSHRERMMAKTGLQGDEYGIAPDERHKSGGGYHCGVKDCQNIGKFHPPATSHVGSSTEDYSVRQLRDRAVGGNFSPNAASAEDIGRGWRNGGSAAWIRFNNLLVKQLQKGDPALRAVREVNFSPNGSARKRWDALHPNDGPNGDGIINSTDSSDTHTHVGFFRDTEGTTARAAALTRIEQITDVAIHGGQLNDTEEDDDMGQTLQGQVPAYTEDEHGNPLGYTIAPGIIAAGAANPRDGWLNFIGDGYGGQFAIRVMYTGGVPDAKGNVGWFAPPEGKGSSNFKFASGQRLNFAIPAGVCGISVMRMAVNEGGTVVMPDPDKGLLPNPHGLGWSIELGPVKH
jgi:hypothetical protein